MRTIAAKLTAAVLLSSASASAHAEAQSPPAFDCASVDSVQAWVRPHPTRPQLVAVLCREDPLPGWWESLWIVDTEGDEPTVLRVRLHGTGIESFAWIDCPGEAMAHVVDTTHMGTLTDGVIRIDGERIEVVDRAQFRRGAGAIRSAAPCP